MVLNCLILFILGSLIKPVSKQLYLGSILFSFLCVPLLFSFELIDLGLKLSLELHLSFTVNDFQLVPLSHKLNPFFLFLLVYVKLTRNNILSLFSIGILDILLIACDALIVPLHFLYYLFQIFNFGLMSLLFFKQISLFPFDIFVFFL